MGGGTGGGRGDLAPAIFSAFNIMPMDVAWNEKNQLQMVIVPPQPSRRGAALGSGPILTR